MFRTATPEDLSGLVSLDRAANLVALRHVFPPERYPFPDAAVLEEWRAMLADPSFDVLVHEGAGGLRAVVAHDVATVRKLAVHPEHWGGGLATLALETALAALRERGTRTARLWCLEDNHRARRLYEHLGWQDTGERQASPWPPHPTMLRYVRKV